MFWRQNSFYENLVEKQTGFLFCFSLICKPNQILQQVTALLVTVNHYQDYKDNQSHLMDNATWEKEWYSTQLDTFHFFFVDSRGEQVKSTPRSSFLSF